MINNLTIIRPTKDDIESAYTTFEVSIADAFEKEEIEDSKEDILREIQHKKNLLNSSLNDPDSKVHFLVAKVENKVIGIVSFGPCGKDIKNCTNNEFDSIGELGSLYILPDYQDKGVGSKLINSMLKYLNKLGIEEFCFDSGYSRAQKRWIKKFGKPYIIAKDYWGEDGDNMIWLCKVKDYIT